MAAGARIGRSIAPRLPAGARPPPPTSRRPAAATLAAAAKAEDERCSGGFLPWLQGKAGTGVSSVLRAGTSHLGRSLFASRHIREGDCIMQVPHNVQLTEDKLPEEVLRLLDDRVAGETTKIAVLLMMEKHLGPESGWAPYVQSLPCKDQMHNMTAPFVTKTYQMVCDPRTEVVLRWGRDNNSFLVADVAGFSQLLLPCFFKHGNFSSFVRQLNAYGFRKVHPDRWEFAHESFLRRNKRGASCSSAISGDKEDMVDEEEEEEEGREALALLDEVRRLRQEQTAIGEQLVRMSRRLQATEERQPDRVMSFLASLAEDPSATATAAQKKRQSMDSPIALPLQPLAVAGAAVDGVWPWAPMPKPLGLTTFEQPTGRSTLPFPLCLLGE